MDDEEKMLIELLTAGVVFCNGDEKTTHLYVNCSDLFVWGSADAQELPYYEIENVHNAYLKKGWEIDKWCCVQRNLQPQSPIIRDMKKSEAWDETLEALPKNQFN